MLNNLKKFYENRKKFIPFKEEIDFTDVFDSFLDDKTERPFLIIGEAPGAKEVELKSPFVGKAGENLNYLISLTPFSRKKDFLITNAFPFRTFKENKNRTPSAKELKVGAELLKKELEIVKPQMIILLGNSSIRAFSYICPEVKHLKKCGFYKACGYKLGICYHPSPLAFNRKNIKNALEKFFRELDGRR